MANSEWQIRRDGIPPFLCVAKNPIYAIKLFARVASSFNVYFAAEGKNLVDKRANIPEGCGIARFCLWEVPEVLPVFNIMSLKKIFVTTLLCALMGVAQAGEPQIFGDYIVHYNAFNSDTLQPSMAEAYNIVRSKNRGIVTISVMKKDVSPVGKPVRASISLNASNLTGQFRNFKTREINEGNSIYYISEFHVAHEEMLDFTMEVLPEGETQSFTVKFRQKFFTQ